MTRLDPSLEGEVAEMKADPARETLAQRIRETLAPRTDVQEKRMFGGVSFMVNGQLAVAAGREGHLPVRVDPAQYQDLLASGGEPAFMGRDRPMGPGWMRVPVGIIADDEVLAWWVAVGRTSRGS